MDEKQKRKKKKVILDELYKKVDRMEEENIQFFDRLNQAIEQMATKV